WIAVRPLGPDRGASAARVDRGCGRGWSPRDQSAAARFTAALICSEHRRRDVVATCARACRSPGDAGVCGATYGSVSDRCGDRDRLMEAVVSLVHDVTLGAHLHSVHEPVAVDDP